MSRQSRLGGDCPIVFAYGISAMAMTIMIFGIISKTTIGGWIQLPPKPGFKLEQLKEDPCLGCLNHIFQKNTNNKKYCCKKINFDDVSDTDQCQIIKECQSNGTVQVNEYNKIFEHNYQNEKFWFETALILILIQALIMFIFRLKLLYEDRYRDTFQNPRLIQRVGQNCRDFVKRICQRNKKQNFDQLNEEMKDQPQISSKDFDIAGEVQE